MTEATLTANIQRALKSQGGPNLFCWKSRGDPRQMKGIPDITGVYKGKFFALEVKLPGREKKLTKNQAEVLARMSRAGGIAVMVTSRREAFEAVFGE